MQGRLDVQLSCSLTLDLICTCVGKKSQDFSGSLSGNTDLRELMTIWKVREMDKTLKNFLLEKVNMYYETCTVELRLEIKERMHLVGSWYSKMPGKWLRRITEFCLFTHKYAFCKCPPSLQMLDSLLRTSSGTFHNIFKLVGFSSLLIFHCLVETMSQLETFNLLHFSAVILLIFHHNLLLYRHTA